MFSSRLSGAAARNRIADAVASARASGRALLDLTVSNPTAAGIEYPRGIFEALASPAAARYEPDPRGLLTAREAIGPDPARLVLTASTSEAYSFLFKLLCDAGDEVLIPRPSYPLFEYLAGLENVRVRPYPLFYDHGWHIDVEALRRAATPRTRAVVVVNPNNPTGSYLTASEYDAIADECRERGLAVISDEVFNDYRLEPRAAYVGTVDGRSSVLSFALGGLSKLAGLPQLKLAWISVSGSASEQALERLELIADTYLSVNTPVQAAAPAILAAASTVRGQIARRTRANLAALRAQPGLRVLAVEGGWYAVVPVIRLCSEEDWVLRLLDREGVLVQPGYFFDFDSEAYLVLSLLTPEAEFSEGARRIAAFSDILQASC